MRVLMFGWEFPPHVSGGLGVACEGLVRGLLEIGTDVTLVLPRKADTSSFPGLRVVVPERPEAPRRRGSRRKRLRLRRIPIPLRPYVTRLGPPPERRVETRREAAPGGLYGPDLSRDVLRYASAAGRIAARERFDVIHAHDWLTFLAGVEARQATGRPLVVHVHATEFDRAGSAGDGFVAAIERFGLAAADRVVAVSRYTADVVEREYGVASERLRVVHNAIEPREDSFRWPFGAGAPVILFAGRITRQKGPDYFVAAAARVAAERPDALFVVAGAGDRRSAMIERVSVARLSERFFFPGFLPPDELRRLYARADVFVMPSASEPFGLAALEALQHGTPVIVSRSAGVSEVVRHVLRVDYGDVDDLASKILSVLAFEPLRRALSSQGLAEVNALSWSDSAAACVAVYRELVGESGQPS
jgi:glycosyltransferase involved in cell wall biosynthesis